VHTACLTTTPTSDRLSQFRMIGLLNAISCGKIHASVKGSPELGQESVGSELTTPTSNTIKHEPPRSPGLPTSAQLSPIPDLKVDDLEADRSSSPEPIPSSPPLQPPPLARSHPAPTGSVSLQPPTPVDGPPILQFGSPFSAPMAMTPDEERQGRSELVASPQTTTDTQFNGSSPNLTLRTPSSGSPVRK